MSICIWSYILFWEGTGEEEENIVMELWQGDSLPGMCYVSHRWCLNSLSLAGEGKEEGGERLKMAPKTINNRNKYKTPPSLLLFLPIVFYAQSFSVLVIIGRHIPSLSCVALRAAAAAVEMRMSVVWEEEEEEGGVSCPEAGSGFWALGFWAVLQQHKGDCSDYFFRWLESNVLPTFWIGNLPGYKITKQALSWLCPLSNAAVVNVLCNSGRRCHLPWLKWMMGIRLLINFVTSITSKLPISPFHIAADTSFSCSKNMNCLVLCWRTTEWLRLLQEEKAVKCKP